MRRLHRAVLWTARCSALRVIGSTSHELARASAEQRAIAGYKLIKGALEFAFALLLWLSVVNHWSSRLGELAHVLRRHVSSGWSIALAEFFVRATTPRGVFLTAVALASDSVLCAFEAWALWRNRWWGPWVVVFTTGSLLPFEVLGYVHHRVWTRLFVLGVNLVIVALLVRRVRIDQKGRHGGPPLHKRI